MPKRLRTRFLGGFSKGLPLAITLNFDISGGDNCDDACPHHPKTTAPEKSSTRKCYAFALEKRSDRTPLLDKLKRHGAMPPALLCGAATIELQGLLDQGITIPWLRISTNGSVPPEHVARTDKLFVSQFRTLLRLAIANRIPVHLPIETATKSRLYRALVGDLVTVRESAYSSARFLRAIHPVSVVAGRAEQTRIERVEAARQLAARRRERTGRKQVVCPAITNSFAAQRNPRIKNDRAKCGKGGCTACEKPEVDIIYPLH